MARIPGEALFRGESTLSDNSPATSKFKSVSLTALLLFLAFAILTLQEHPHVTLVVAAMLAGWSEANGLCGISHISSITQLRPLDHTNSLWLRGVLSYTVGGMLTSAVIGLIVGLVPIDPSPLIALVVAVVGVIFLLRENGWLRFDLPQVHRQTYKMWADEFGFVTGAGMWGAHIGLGFATVIRHCGIYMVVLSAALQGPVFAAGIFVSYWIGRTLPIWTAPIACNGLDHSRLPHFVEEGRIVYRMMASTAIVFLVLAIEFITARG